MLFYRGVVQNLILVGKLPFNSAFISLYNYHVASGQKNRAFFASENTHVFVYILKEETLLYAYPIKLL